MESDTNKECSGGSQEKGEDPSDLDAETMEKILKNRALLLERKKALEEREVDFDNEEEEEKLFAHESQVRKILLEIERKLLKYNVLKGVSDDYETVLTGGFQHRIFITGTGNEVVNQRITAALREKGSKEAAGFDNRAIFLTRKEIEDIVTAVTEEQLAKGATSHLPPLKTDKDAFDSFILNAANIIHQTVKEARNSKGLDKYDDYLTEEEAKKLRAEEEKNPAPEDSGISRELAYAIMQREGEAELREGRIVEDPVDAIVLSDDEAAEEGEDDMNEINEKSTTVLNNIGGVGEITQRDVEEIITEDMPRELRNESIAPLDVITIESESDGGDEASSEEAIHGQDGEERVEQAEEQRFQKEHLAMVAPPEVITIGSESDGVPQKDPEEPARPELVLHLYSKPADDVAVNVSNAEDRMDSTRFKPDWLKGETSAELVACFTARLGFECIDENIEGEGEEEQIDTSKNCLVSDWLVNGDKVREKTPVEVIDVSDYDEEEKDTGIGMKRGPEGDGEEESPVRKARIGEDLGEGDWKPSSPRLE